MNINQKNEFIGRHEEFCIVKDLLGEEVSTLERQISINKDRNEYNEILNKLIEIEEYIKSENFTHSLDVLHVHDEIMALINKAGTYCVLQNDLDLEDRCFKILESTYEYTKASMKSKSELTQDKIDALDGIIQKTKLANFLSYLQLHDLLNTKEHQMAFYIWNSLFKKNGFIVTLLNFNKGSNNMDEYNKNLESFAEELFKQKKIDADDLKKIEDEINYK